METELRREVAPWTHLSPPTYSRSKAWFLPIWNTLEVERKWGRERGGQGKKRD